MNTEQGEYLEAGLAYRVLVNLHSSLLVKAKQGAYI